MRPLLPVLTGLFLYIVVLISAELYSPFMHIESRYLLVNNEDDMGFAAIKIRQLRHTNQQQFIFMGASSLREALWPDIEFKTKEKKIRPPVVDISSGAQAFTDSLIMMRAIGSNNKILILGMGPKRLNINGKNIKYFERSGYPIPRRDDLFLGNFIVPASTGENLELSQFFKQLKRKVSQRLLKMLKSNFDPDFNFLRYRYELKSPYPPETKAAAEAYLRDVAAAIPTTIPLATDALKQILDFTKTYNWVLILLEMPLTAEAKNVLGASYTLYEQTVEKWAAENSIPFIRPQNNITLEANDFYDHVHLLPSGRTKYHKEVTSQLNELVLKGWLKLE